MIRLRELRKEKGMTQEENLRSYEHEHRHTIHNDFQNEKNATMIEQCRHDSDRKGSI